MLVNMSLSPPMVWGRRISISASAAPVFSMVMAAYLPSRDVKKKVSRISSALWNSRSLMDTPERLPTLISAGSTSVYMPPLTPYSGLSARMLLCLAQ